VAVIASLVGAGDGLGMGDEIGEGVMGAWIGGLWFDGRDEFGDPDGCQVWGGRGGGGLWRGCFVVCDFVCWSLRSDGL